MTSIATQAVQVAQSATTIAADAYAGFHSQQCDAILGPIDAADVVTDAALLTDMLTAAELSAAIYKYTKDALPASVYALSVGLDDRPDCTVHRSDSTLWITVRGTQTLKEDVLHDVSWCSCTAIICGVDVPIAVVQKCEVIYRKLALYLEAEVPETRRRKLRRVRFTGHRWVRASAPLPLHIYYHKKLSIMPHHPFLTNVLMPGLPAPS